LGAGIANFQFVFSLPALRKTILYFGLTFVLIVIFNVIMVRKQRLIDLIYAARRNEKFKAPRLSLSVLLFLISLTCLFAAYFIVLKNGLLVAPLIWIAVGLGVLGTFLFFFSLSGFFLKLIQQMRGFYLKNLNMFVLRQINSKINTTYVAITFVCLMLFVSICTLSSGMGLAKAITAEVLKSTPYSATLSTSAQYIYETGTYEDYKTEGVDLVAVAEAHGAKLNDFAKAYFPMRYYNGGAPKFDIKNNAGQSLDFWLDYAKLSDYNRILQAQGTEPLTLADGSYAVDSTTANDKWVEFAKETLLKETLTVGGVELSAKPTQFFAHALETTDGPNFGLVIIVPDELLANAPAKRDLLHIQYIDDNSYFESLAVESLAGVQVEGLSSLFDTKTLVIERNSSNTTTISYLAVYIGVIFLIAAATVLSIIQLSEANENVRRYKLLHKIGTEDRMINRSGFLQILIYFGVPLVLAIAHSTVGIIAASNLINTFQGIDILGSSLITALIIISVYGGYFLTTYFGSKNVINREYSIQDKEE
jgi:putative ABC transport system permease protein